MPRIEKTVFISYRRTNFYTALAVYQDLTAHGYDVFFDYQSIDSGNFANIIINNVRARAHFLVLLSPSALEHCNQPDDWFRREIETAIAEKRNIVPLLMEGFDFGSTAISQALSGKLASLKTYNGLRLYADYFFDGMEKLRTRYLTVALDDINAHVLSDETKKANEVNRTIANEATQVEVTQLTSEEWFERAYVYDEANNTDEAIRCYTEAIELNPSFAIAHANLGNLFEKLKRYEEAEDAYSKAIIADPNDAFFHTLLAGLLKELGRFSEAEDMCRKAIAVDPNDAYSYTFLADLLKELGRFSEAEDAFRKAIAVDPNDAYSHTLFGNLLKELERFSEAEDAYRKAVATNPNYSYGQNSLGNLLKELGRFSEAESSYRRVIEFDPSYMHSYKDLVGLLRFNLKDRLEESLPLLEKLIEINQEDFNSYVAIVSVSKHLGKNISKDHVETARQFMPEDDWYNRACLESVCDNFDLAFEHLQKAVQKERFKPAWAWEDPDLQWIRDDPRFVEIVGPKPEK